jgi:hypothetical protein
VAPPTRIAEAEAVRPANTASAKIDATRTS